MSDAQQLVLSKIIHDGDIVPVLDAGVTEEYFSQERWGEVWRWVYKYWSEHQVPPELSTYTRRFPQPNYKLGTTTEPMSALIEELRDARVHAITLSGMQEAIDAFETNDLQSTLEGLGRLLSQVNSEVSTSVVTSVSSLIGRAVHDAINRKYMEITGLPTGFPTIDLATAGIQSEQLVTLIGLPKTGKTSILLAIALVLMRHGYRVLFVSFEMSIQELEERLLSIGAEVCLNNILRGGLDEAEKNKLYDFEAEVTDSHGEIIFVHDRGAAATVGRVAALQEQHQPDITFIDGAYMMHDEQGEKDGSSQAITNITRSLKRLCQKRHRPIFLSTQALYSRTNQKKGPKGDSAGYSSSWQQDSDVYMGIHRADYNVARSELSIIFARNALGTKTTITFDYSFGIIREEGTDSIRGQTLYQGDEADG